MAEYKNELILQDGSGNKVSIDLRNALVMSSAPTTATKARIGMQAYVVSGGTITEEYVCTAVSGSTYTWVLRESGGGVELDTTLTQSGKAADAKAVGDVAAGKVSLPRDGGGAVLCGKYGQVALSDGAGGILWGTASSGGGTGDPVVSSKSVTLSGSGVIRDSTDGNMSMTGWELPEGATEMVVTARKSMNIFAPALAFRGTAAQEWKELSKNGQVVRKGLTITYADGVITVNGTASETVGIPFIDIEKPFWLKSGTYQLAGCPTSGSSTTYAVQWKRSDTDVTLLMDYGPNANTSNPNIPITEDAPVRANVVIYKGCVCENVQFYCQILAGLDSGDRTGWYQYVPFEGKSVVVDTSSTPPVADMPCFKGYTAIDCVGGSVTLEYPISVSGGGGTGGSPETVIERHYDDAEFTVTKLNDSNQFSQNGITFVGDELWMSKESSVYYDNGTMIFRYKVTDGEFIPVGTCDCDFGHLNTIDYCEANDCLIFGNGGNDTETTGNYFVVVKNPRSLGAEAFIADVGIKYDVDVGFKVQALWGGSNNGGYNIVYLLSNNASKITKILLLKDENGDFNGEYVTLESHDLEAWGVQDADIFGDTLYIGGQLGGNTDAAVKEISLSDYSTKGVTRRKFYADDGTPVTACVQGIYVDQNAVWICANTGDTTKPVCLTKYRAGSTGNTSDQSLSETVASTVASHYRGKYVSFYGDSITTYTGYVPEGNTSEYTGSSLGVTDVHETWWMRTLDVLGMNLLVNNSWSGRCVTTIRDTDTNLINSAGCRMENVEILKTAERDPDIIIVKLGVNDFMRISGVVTLGSYDATEAVPTEPSTDFSDAYALMLYNIRTAFPNAELWCCTINQMSRKAFPNKVDSVSLYDINNVIVKIAEIFGAKTIRHDECGITVFNGAEVFGDYANNMGLHPNAVGHKLIADNTVRTMLSK